MFTRDASGPSRGKPAGDAEGLCLLAAQDPEGQAALRSNTGSATSGSTRRGAAPVPGSVAATRPLGSEQTPATPPRFTNGSQNPLKNNSFAKPPVKDKESPEQTCTCLAETFQQPLPILPTLTPTSHNLQFILCSGELVL